MFHSPLRLWDCHDRTASSMSLTTDRLKSGHFTCQFDRTYHMSTTAELKLTCQQSRRQCKRS